MDKQATLNQIKEASFKDELQKISSLPEEYINNILSAEKGYQENVSNKFPEKEKAINIASLVGLGAGGIGGGASGMLLKKQIGVSRAPAIVGLSALGTLAGLLLGRGIQGHRNMKDPEYAIAHNTYQDILDRAKDRAESYSQTAGNYDPAVRQMQIANMLRALNTMKED